MAIYSATITTTSSTIIAANDNRRKLIITNTGASDVFINYGANAEVNKGIFLTSGGGVFVMDNFTFTQLEITGITASGSTNISILEL